MGKKLVVGENDLRTWCLQNDKQSYLDEWDYESNDLKPDEIAYGSTRKVNWVCSQGHKYQETVNQRTYRGRGCPYCSGHRVFAGFNDLHTWCLQNNRNNILDEWDYDNNDIKPTEITHGSGRNINWICSQGHKYSMMLNARTSNRHGCPYCAGHRVWLGYNDLQTWCEQNDTSISHPYPYISTTSSKYVFPFLPNLKSSWSIISRIASKRSICSACR